MTMNPPQFFCGGFLNLSESISSKQAGGRTVHLLVFFVDRHSLEKSSNHNLLICRQQKRWKLSGKAWARVTFSSPAEYSRSLAFFCRITIIVSYRIGKSARVLKLLRWSDFQRRRLSNLFQPADSFNHFIFQEEII